MKTHWPDSVMRERRQERLRHLNTFMRFSNTSEGGLNPLARGACLSLLAGWFQNSKWAVVRYVAREAARESWERLTFSLQIFWHKRVMRRTHEQTGAILFGDEHE